MPYQRTLKEQGPLMETEISISGPNYFFISNNFATKVFTLIKHRGELFAPKLLAAAEKAYGSAMLAPLRKTFQIIARAIRGEREVISGLEADPFIRFVEYTTKPIWPRIPPLNRTIHGVSVGGGIAAWTGRLKQKKRGRFRTPITPYMVAVSVAKKGTKGKYAVTNAQKVALKRWERDMIKDIDKLFRED